MIALRPPKQVQGRIAAETSCCMTITLLEILRYGKVCFWKSNLYYVRQTVMLTAESRERLRRELAWKSCDGVVVRIQALQIFQDSNFLRESCHLVVGQV